MASFAAAYQHEDNSAWINHLVADIIDSQNRANCRTYGQDYDDDLVDDPDYQSSGDERTDLEKPEEEPTTQDHAPSDQDLRAPQGVPGRFSSIGRSKSRSSSSPPLNAYRHIRRKNSQRAEPRSSGKRKLQDGSSQVLASPNSAFLVQTSSRLAPTSSASTVQDGTNAQPTSPNSATSERPIYRKSSKSRSRDVVSPLSMPPARSPPPNYNEIAKPRRALYRSLSSQGWEKRDEGDRSPTLKRQLSTLSEFSGFLPHPAVRPFVNRDVLGEAAGPTEDDTEYPKPLALSLIILGICLSVFIISLDRNIITTAIPQITARFHSYDDIGWYGSAYLLTASAFQPLYGRIYMSFDTKSSFLVALTVFELGSLIGALAPSSSVLIVGRAIQGLGSAGILTGSFVVGTHSVRLQKRPVLFATVGILYGVGALCGPLLGGAFTDTIGWRWCFWINLPVGLITFACVFLFFKRRAPSTTKPRPPFLKRVLNLDLIGNVILLGACTMLFLALQLSETKYSWSSSRVVGLLVGFGITTLLFITWLLYKGENALIPPRIVRQRTVAASCTAAFFIYGTTLIHAYYLPIFFQAIKGTSAVHSGVNMIPYMLANATFSLLAGIFVSKNGLFAPPAILGTAIGTIGCGLLATLKPTTSTAMWAGFELLVSAGLGMAIQQGFSAVQTALPLHEVPIGTAAVVASQSAGGAIFVSVGNTLLQNHLLNANSDNTIPGVNVRAVVELGATMFRDHVPKESLPALVELYNDSLQAVFVAAVPLCGLAFFASLCMEWRSVKGKQSETGMERGKDRNAVGEGEKV